MGRYLEIYIIHNIHSCFIGSLMRAINNKAFVGLRSCDNVQTETSIFAYMQAGQGFKYKELVCPAGLSSWSVQLVCPVGLSSWSVQLVCPAGLFSWSVQLIGLAGPSSWSVQLVYIQSCNVAILVYCQNLPKVAISCDNVQT